MTVNEGGKRKRNSRACDRCHRNACRCSPGVAGTVCGRCRDQGVECTYDRPVKRRGPNPTRRGPRGNQDSPMLDGQHASTSMSANMNVEAPVRPASVSVQSGSSSAAASVSPRGGSRSASVSEIGLSSSSLSSLYAAYENTIPPRTIECLVEVFHHTIYPIRPYLHWPTFSAQITSQLYRTDWGVFVVTMAVCALTAGRLYEGIPATTPAQGLELALLRPDSAALSATCYRAAVAAMPRSPLQISDYIAAMKAHALLASACLQNGDLKSPVTHLGDYASLSILNGFYAENKWPNGLTEVERQERRRLFWCVYQQEQYMVSNFGLPARHPQPDSHSVLYPAEVIDDADITATGVRLPLPTNTPVSFIRGCNFCSDLYQLLANNRSTWHKDTINPERKEDFRGSEIQRFIAGAHTQSPKLSASDSLHLISKAQQELPECLRAVKALTSELGTDRYSFVAANIIFTTQNAKMLIVQADTPTITINRCCDIASDLLDELSSMPLTFFNAISTSSLHHLSHIGHLLGTTITHRPLSAWRYIQVRNILLVLADLLEKIESSRSASVSISPTPFVSGTAAAGSNSSLTATLRAQIREMDGYMARALQAGSTERTNAGAGGAGTGLLVMGQTLLLPWGVPAPVPVRASVGERDLPTRSASEGQELNQAAGTINLPRAGSSSPANANTNPEAQTQALGLDQLLALVAQEPTQPLDRSDSNVNSFSYLLQTGSSESAEFEVGALDGSAPLLPEFSVEGWTGLGLLK
ncbi:hypothetical protein AtubIFM61612_010684 [Aspergillus tubingensis]|nr:hypothetical protein AtubIFM57143_007524 [Aspergillus tubingensis]GLB20740.1 hypothetical protein AtubIFM61612_010684 [Aspergillus tubingensis]